MKYILSYCIQICFVFFKVILSVDQCKYFDIIISVKNCDADLKNADVKILCTC